MRPGTEPGEGPGNKPAGGRGDAPDLGGPAKQVKANPPPAVEPPPANPDDSPAADSGTSLAIRKVQDLLRENKFTPDVEQRLGMTREEADQFVKKYERSVKPRQAAREGRELKVTPKKDERQVNPNHQAPEKLPDLATSKRSDRGGNVVPTDELHNLNEGARSPVPKALQARMKAYSESLARSPVTAPARRPAAPAAKGGNSGTNP
jgi:hypothetical protein